VSAVDVRRPAGSGTVLALASHGPAPGLHFQPVDDFIVSVVHRSSHAEVVRDIGQGRQTFTDAPRRVFVTPARTPSYWSFAGTPMVLHIAFPWREVQAFVELPEEDAMRRMHSLARAPFEEPVLNTVAWRLWAAAGHGGHVEDLFTEHALHLLLATLLLRSSEDVSGVASGARLAPWQLRRAQEFMRSRLSDPMRLADIARTVGLSQHHFLRAYKASTGQTPFLWFTQQRIERAKELMARRNMPLTEVAYALGFSSLGHFSTTFRRVTGKTPTGWRQEWVDGSA